VQNIGRELGVAYVLEGSVRKEANQVRITAQLVDATTGDHLWAAHYDSPLRDIFSLQDEIVRRIVTTLKLRLSLEQWREAVGQHTDNLDAYDDYLRGWRYYWSFTEEGNVKATQMFEKAIQRDPTYADAYTDLGIAYWLGWINQWSEYDSTTLDRAIQLEQQAIALDDGNARAHAILGRLYVYKRQFEKAVAEGERSIELAPNSAVNNWWLSAILNRSGKPAESISFAEKAARLDPRNRDFYEFDIGLAYLVMGRYEEAIPFFKTHLVHYPNNMSAHYWLVIAYSELRRKNEARNEAAEVLRISPHFSVEVDKERSPLRDQTLVARFGDDMRKAGLN
jgi:adenylate cyclase